MANEKPKHTPGPWRLGNEGSGSVVSDHKYGVHISRYEKENMEYYGGHVVAETITPNNINLICAAPELLAACVEFVRKCDCGEARSIRSYAEMKAAIAKATGEQQ